jgi:hypothetical protein
MSAAAAVTAWDGFVVVVEAISTRWNWHVPHHLHSRRVVPGSRQPHQLYTHPFDVVIAVPSHGQDNVADPGVHRGCGGAREREIGLPRGRGQRRPRI